MTRRTIITYHSLEAAGSSKDPSVRSQNLSASSHSRKQHTANETDASRAYQQKISQLRQNGTYFDLEFPAPAQTGPAQPFTVSRNAPASPGAYPAQANRVVSHVSTLSGTADRQMTSLDDSRIGMLRTAPRATYGRDADLTVVGEAYLTDPSYTGILGSAGSDNRHYQARIAQSANGKTSNGFSWIDGFSPDITSFSSQARLVASGQSFVVIEVNDIVAAFVHTPNADAKVASKAAGFYAKIKPYAPDIIMGDTNQNGSIAAFFGPTFQEFPRARTLVFARPPGFTLSGTNSVRDKFFDQIVYNAATTEIDSARYIPSDISGATMSDHFGLIVCARRKGKPVHARDDDGNDDGSGGRTAKRQRTDG